MAVTTRSLDGITGFVRVLGLGLCIYIYTHTYVSLSLRQFFRYTLQFARLCSSCRSFEHFQRREVEVVSTLTGFPICSRMRELDQQKKERKTERARGTATPG